MRGMLIRLRKPDKPAASLCGMLIPSVAAVVTAASALVQARVDEESPNCWRALLRGFPGTVLANGEAEQSDGKCNRKDTALCRARAGRRVKGEMGCFHRTARVVTSAARQHPTRLRARTPCMRWEPHPEARPLVPVGSQLGTRDAPPRGRSHLRARLFGRPGSWLCAKALSEKWPSLRQQWRRQNSAYLPPQPISLAAA